MYHTYDLPTDSKYDSRGATTLKGYSFFVGGATGLSGSAGYPNGSIVKTVDLYDTSRTKISAQDLTTARALPQCCNINETYALVAGGYDALGNFSNSNVTELYDQSGIRYTCQFLTFESSDSAICEVADMAIVTGSSTNACAFNSTGTLLSCASTSHVMGNARATYTGNKEYALFAGGETSFATTSNLVDRYNSSLTRGSVSAMTSSRRWQGACNLNNDIAVFACGSYSQRNGSYGSTFALNNADGYNSSLVKLTLPSFSRQIGQLNGVSCNRMIMFVPRDATYDAIIMNDSLSVVATDNLHNRNTNSSVCANGDNTVLVSTTFNVDTNIDIYTYIEETLYIYDPASFVRRLDENTRYQIGNSTPVTMQSAGNVTFKNPFNGWIETKNQTLSGQHDL